jgi:hypothetical protein
MTAPRSAAQRNSDDKWQIKFRPLNADGDAAARRPYHRKTYRRRLKVDPVIANGSRNHPCI